MGGKKKQFESELHILCERGRWDQVCSILTSILESQKEKDIDTTNKNKAQGKVEDDAANVDNDERYRSSGARQSTCATTNYSTSFGDDNGDEGDGDGDGSCLSSVASASDASSANSFDEDLRMSYENNNNNSSTTTPSRRKKEIHQARASSRNTKVSTNKNKDRSRSAHSRRGSNETGLTRQITTTTDQNYNELNSDNGDGDGDGGSFSSIQGNTEYNDPNPNSPKQPSSQYQLSCQQTSEYQHQLTSREGVNSWTPLLIASVYAPPIVISLLIKACPAAVSIPDRSGNLPLHIVACWRLDSSHRFRGATTAAATAATTAGSARGGATTHHEVSALPTTQSQSPSTSMEKEAHELCLVLYMLLSSYPDALATTNRWNQTPLHSLFESKYIHHHHHHHSSMSGGTGTSGGRNSDSGELLCLIQTLLGMWEDNFNHCDNESFYNSSYLNELFSEYTATITTKTTPEPNATTTTTTENNIKPQSTTEEEQSSKTILQTKKILTPQIKSAIQRSLRARDTKGRLPLHCAAECHWVNEQMLRTLVLSFPNAVWIPVLPPMNFHPTTTTTAVSPTAGMGMGHTMGINIRNSVRSGGSVLSGMSWDVNRNAILPVNSMDDEVLDDNGNTRETNTNNSTNPSGGSGSGVNDGLFPKTGGCYGKDLAVHLLHRRYLTPLHHPHQHHQHQQHHPSNKSHEEENEVWSRSSGGASSTHTDASVFLNENHCGAISALLEPLVKAAGLAENMNARLACAATGSGVSSNNPRQGSDMDNEGHRPSMNSYFSAAPTLTSTTILPLHIAALHGVSHEVLEGLCRAYPEGAVTPMITPLHYDRLNTLPIELFEEGRAGHEVNMASDVSFLKLSVDYFHRSDLLFSYFPEAISSKKVVYCRDLARLGRFEQLIKREAYNGGSDNNSDGLLLLDMAGSVWLFLCRSYVDTSKLLLNRGGVGRAYRGLPNFGAAIGRIVEGLEPHSISRLNFLRTTSIPEGVRVPPLANGRTVVDEAKERAPSGSMGRMLEEHFFHSSILEFLNATDALSYSTTCRKAWTRGVRLLPRIANNSGGNNKMKKMDSRASWKLSGDWCGSETSTQEEDRSGKVSMPWQKLELPFVPSCTHTVFITCDVAYQSWEGDEPIICEGGGLLVISEDVTSTKNAQSQPDLVVASMPVEAGEEKASPQAGDESQQEQQAKKKTTRVRFSFNHLFGRSYTIWYYGSERHTLTISNLSVRQLVYSCDYNGHNPLHVLLCEGDNPSNLKEQLGALISAGFGTNLPIHYALKVGVLERTLRCLIEANPAALLHIDSERRTPIHAALDSSRVPYLGIIQALLMSQGVNATHLKDANGKLPIHLAAEHGAGEALLRLLVDAYADGCYRRTDDGDLPVHLLVRSGSATPVTVDLLLRPIIHNPTICAYPGSVGVNLPLHIAAEYRCKYNILEGLLSSYSEAARTQRQLLQPETKMDGKKRDAQYALQIFEAGRGAEEMSLNAANGKSEPGSKNRESAAIGEADFNLRSDFIFVHNPNVPKSVRPYLTTYYRDERERIHRLAAVIKREALQCSKKIELKEEAELTEMAQLAWCWMCGNDYYAEVISDIVVGLPIAAVRFLALTENPKSEPVPDTPIKDCSTPRCALIIKSRLSFLGRYVLDRDSAPLHKLETCVILRAKDIGAMESFLSIQTLMSDSEPDIDDYSHGCGSVYAITGNTIEVDRFTHFAKKIGLTSSEAISDIEDILLDSSTTSSSTSDMNMATLKQSGVKKSVFSAFCKLHGIDDNGCRSVVIKFMKSKQSFELEKQCRDILRESGKSSHVIPILNHFSFEREGTGDSSDFTRDIFGTGPPSMNLSALKFGIVMPCANGDLRDIVYREGISSANLRENARQVGQTLLALHEQGISHMNLQLKNVLRFGNQMVLSDFGSAIFLKSIEGVNAIGGSSTKICPSILPPEMVAKIELSNRDCFDQLMRYWKYVHADANHLRTLTPHERQSLSQFVKSRRNNESDGQRWKDDISSLLETIKFEDLPLVLSKCTSLKHFSDVWERMCQNYDLWETIVRPRVDEQKQCVYLLKAFENREGYPDRDVSALPYKLVTPSEKVDVWTFGVFIYELCSGGNPFHTGYRGDLRGVEAYSRLFEWDRSAAERSIREHVQDPLAQDLLSQILVPAEERLPSISAVLEHPFFLPESVEAERYLEKHEEMQLLRDNTVTVRKVTKSVKHMLDDSMEKYCKLGFATDQIAFPTCLVVLPYGLTVDETLNRPIASSNPRIISCAVRLGKCLLEINKATARLSFWLMMSGKMKGGNGNEFKFQMQDWLKRARYEPCSTIAREMTNGLGCGKNYATICEEVLAYDGNISKAKSYMRDPVRAARRAVKQNSEELAVLYQTYTYLYLVDEVTLLPNCSSRRSQAYPIQLEPNPKVIANVLLPFMNIVVMKALAKGGFEGLANLLGLPPQHGIPESWLSTEPGLLHSSDNSASIEDFVILQKILRNDDLSAFRDDKSISRSIHSGMGSAYDNASQLSLSALGLANIDLSPGDPTVAVIPMTQLELLFRERDPDREFGKLKRITTGSPGSKTLGLWTNIDTIRQLKGMVEIAGLEEQLRELKTNLDKTKDAATQYSNLMSKRKHLKQNMPINMLSPTGDGPFSFDESLDDAPGILQENLSYEQDDGRHNMKAPTDSDDGGHSRRGSKNSHQFQDEKREPRQHPSASHTEGDTEEKLEISTHRMRPAAPPIDQTPKTDPDEAGAKKKMRKSKRRFRPWFTAC